MEFHQTVMGRTFYEGTMPSLVQQLKRLNENVEKLLAKEAAPVASEAPVASGDSTLRAYAEGKREGAKEMREACQRMYDRYHERTLLFPDFKGIPLPGDDQT